MSSLQETVLLAEQIAASFAASNAALGTASCVDSTGDVSQQTDDKNVGGANSSVVTLVYDAAVAVEADTEDVIVVEDDAVEGDTDATDRIINSIVQQVHEEVCQRNEVTQEVENDALSLLRVRNVGGVSYIEFDVKRTGMLTFNPVDVVAAMEEGQKVIGTANKRPTKVAEDDDIKRAINVCATSLSKTVEKGVQLPLRLQRKCSMVKRRGIVTPIDLILYQPEPAASAFLLAFNRFSAELERRMVGKTDAAKEAHRLFIVTMAMTTYAKRIARLGFTDHEDEEEVVEIPADDSSEEENEENDDDDDSDDTGEVTLHDSNSDEKDDPLAVHVDKAAVPKASQQRMLRMQDFEADSDEPVRTGNSNASAAVEQFDDGDPLAVRPIVKPVNKRAHLPGSLKRSTAKSPTSNRDAQVGDKVQKVKKKNQSSSSVTSSTSNAHQTDKSRKSGQRGQAGVKKEIHKRAPQPLTTDLDTDDPMAIAANDAMGGSSDDDPLK